MANIHFAGKFIVEFPVGTKSKFDEEDFFLAAVNPLGKDVIEVYGEVYETNAGGFCFTSQGEQIVIGKGYIQKITAGGEVLYQA